MWDFRWPDPVAMQVAATRLLGDRQNESLNLGIGIRAQLEGDLAFEECTRGLLVSPWAVERLFWCSPGIQRPPMQSAYELTINEQGWFAAGQGVILLLERQIPVLTAWEYETGHYFVQTLLAPVTSFRSADEAMAAALGTPLAAAPTLKQTLDQPVSRRHLFAFFRGRS